MMEETMVRNLQSRVAVFLLCGPCLTAACGKVEPQRRERVGSETASVSNETVTKRRSSSSEPKGDARDGVTTEQTAAEARRKVPASDARKNRGSNNDALVSVIRGVKIGTTEERATYALGGESLPNGFEVVGTAFYLYPKARTESVPVYLCTKDEVAVPSLDVGCRGGARGRLVGHAAKEAAKDTEPVHLSSDDETPSFHAPKGVEGGDA